uniref:hypothetical protein n=1 Tax=Candidatus Electrothrix sp. TaxID=2170559 RepID=UPI004057BE95
MRMGLGLGLTKQSGKGHSPSPEDTIKAAIKERKHVRAIRGEVGVLIQPYALLKVEGVSILHGVVTVVEGDAVGAWSIDEISVASLSGVEVYDATFTPSDAFNRDDLSGVVAVVEPVDPFKDAGQDGVNAD